MDTLRKNLNDYKKVFNIYSKLDLNNLDSLSLGFTSIGIPLKQSLVLLKCINDSIVYVKLLFTKILKPHLYYKPESQK